MPGSLFQYQLYVLLAPVSVALSALGLLFLLPLVAKDRKHLYLVFLLVLTVFLPVATAMELRADNPASLLGWSRMTYALISLSPVAWLFHVASLMEKNPLPSPLVKAGFFVVPAITIIMTFTNDFHHLLWDTHQLVETSGWLVNVVSRYGPWFPVHVGYSWFLMLASGVLAVRESLLSPHHRSQVFAAIWGLAIPVSANLVYLFRLMPGYNRDFSGLLLGISSVVLVASAWRSHQPVVSPAIAVHPGAADPAPRLPAEGILPVLPHPDRPIPPDDLPGALFSRREEEVIRLLLQDLPHKAISDRLCISANTLKTHVRNILRKTGCSSTREFCLRCRAGIIDLSGIVGEAIPADRD